MGKRPDSGRLWPGFTGPEGVILASDGEVDRRLRHLQPGSKVFGVVRDMTARRIDCVSSERVIVPKVFYKGDRGLNPEAVEQHMLPIYGGVKPTPGSNARLIMSDVIASAYTPGLPWWLAEMARKVFFRGPLMIGTGLFLKDAIQIDLTGAYLWALSQPLPFGHPVELEKDPELLMRLGMSGIGQCWIDDKYGLLRDKEQWRTPGKHLYIGALPLLYEAMHRGIVTPLSAFRGWIWPTAIRNMDLIHGIEDRSFRKTVYQLGWPTYDQGYSAGRVLTSLADLTSVDIVDPGYPHIVWRYIPPATWKRTNPHIAAHVCSLVTSRVIDVIATCTEKNVSYGNVIVDSIIVPSGIVNVGDLQDSLGYWRLSKGPGVESDLSRRIAKRPTWFECGEKPTEYTGGDSRGRMW